MKPLLFTSFLLSFFLNIQTIHAQIVINEFSAANHQQFFDNYGEAEDWIELYNSSNSTVNLGGYHLSDKMNKPTKWTIPAGTSIPAHGFLLIWASNRDEHSNGFLHSNFKITQTKKSESIVLADPQGNLIDSHQLDIPNQTNHSWARISDGGEKWGIQTLPTPGSSNIDVLFPYPAKPKLIPEAGFYDQAAEISIENIDPEVSIYYTTDGSTPSLESTIYSGPFTIQNTSIVKAIAISSDPNTPNSFIDFKTYFIEESHTVPVVSLSGIELQQLLEGTIAEPTGTLELFENGSRVASATGEFNKHGHDSWAYSQRGIDYITRDEFGENYTLKHKIFSDQSDRNKFQRIILKAAANDNYPFENGGAHIRDAFVHTLSQKAGLHLDERTYEPCVLYLNGKYWGVYEMREKVDDPDFTSYYYKQGKNSIDFIKTWGATWEEYGSRSDWDQLREFIESNDMSVQQNYEVVENQLDIESLIDYVVLHSYNVSSDWLNWNTAWWRGTNPSGEVKKWRYILWDEDATFGHYINYSDIPDRSPLADPCNPEAITPNIDNQGHIAVFKKLSENPEFFAKYINRYADLSNSYFNCDFMLNLLDQMLTRIESEMPRHINRWGGSMSEWQENVQKLKDFINTRCTVISDGIVDCYTDEGITGPFEIVIDVEKADAGKVQANSVVGISYPWQTNYFGGIDFAISAIPNEDQVFDHWEVENNIFGPDEFSDSIAMSLVSGDKITAFFSSKCGAFYDLKVDSSLSSLNLAWRGPNNALNYEISYREKENGEWKKISTQESKVSLKNLSECIEYEVVIKNICGDDSDNFHHLILKTACRIASFNSEKNILSANIFPNPFESNLTIELELLEAENINIELLNITGQPIHSQSFNDTQEGTNQFIFKTNNLSQGMYLLKIISKDEIHVQKIIKGE